MNQTITPVKTASLGVLLIALWLIVQGVFNALGLIFLIWDLPNSFEGVTLTVTTVCLLVLWKTLPLTIGIVLFQQHRSIVRWFYDCVLPENEEPDGWHNSASPAILLVGLLGLFLISGALNAFCNEHLVMMRILEIDNKMPIPPHRYSDANPSWYTPIVYPLFLGLVFVIGAGRIGICIGKAIDKSLESPAEKEEDELS
ncbi:MAG: hypothetical protein FWE67_04795 [Planctomycetaceae bacterium]|nr:hypothetical protein [Planctomycetaceae bacterium]